MRRNSNKIRIKKPAKMQYLPKKTLFSSKEIIFRSGGRAKVFNISSKVQIFALVFLLVLGIWSAYSYHMYHKSDKLKYKLNRTRDAYAELMSDFVAVHKNISSMFDLISQEDISDELEINRYLQQTQVIEDKIKQMTDEKDWLENEDVNLRDAILERDRAVSERNLLLSKIKQLETSVQKLEASEMEILEKVERLSETEAKKIRDAISAVNKSLKKQNKYFNPDAGGKKNSTGGKFEAAPEVDSKDLNQKMQDVFSKIDDLNYYREVIKSVPVGKPVWHYVVTSPFGHRADPFNKKSAAHKGVDLASHRGNVVKTMAKGKVVRAEWGTGFGNHIEIDHENGFKTKYAHLNKMYVKKGDIVSQGQKIGEVGSTGRSTGPHLHYEVIYLGANVDPMSFMAAWK